MRSNFKLALGTLLALMPAAPASSEDRGASSGSSNLSKCQNTVILNGIVSRGSAVCNQAWLDRPGSLVVLRAAQACNKTPRLKALLSRGMSDFDRKVKELGKAAACQEIDETIQQFE
jgi:hypothetical protein